MYVTVSSEQYDMMWPRQAALFSERGRVVVTSLLKVHLRKHIVLTMTTAHGNRSNSVPTWSLQIRGDAFHARVIENTVVALETLVTKSIESFSEP